ncbi:MAG: hypothetical protein AAF528_04140 [Cyanobacteria bacterium P01_C01_bin.121]
MSSKLAKPILAATCASLSLALFVRTEGWFNAVVLTIGGATGLYALDKLEGHSLDDIYQGGVHLFKELTYQVPMAGDAVGSVKIMRQGLVEDFLKGITDKGDLTTPNHWDAEHAKRSAIVVGQKNSGKTKVQEYRFQQRLNAGVHCMVSDIHYRAKVRGGRESANWTPGVPAEEFEKSYLLETPTDTLNYLQYLYEEGRKRIQGESWSQELHLTIEEWQGCVNEWLEEIRVFNAGEQKQNRVPEDMLVSRAVNAIKQISNQYDKVGIQVDITLHSLTRDQSHLDAGILNACDLYACGSAISNRSNQFPSDLNVKEMSRERAETALALEIPQRAIVYRDCQSSLWRVIVAPDLRTEFAFELVEPDEVTWLQQNKPEIEALLSQGKSKTAIAQSLKVPQVNSDARWLALKDFVSELEAV